MKLRKNSVHYGFYVTLTPKKFFKKSYRKAKYNLWLMVFVEIKLCALCLVAEKYSVKFNSTFYSFLYFDFSDS